MPIYNLPPFGNRVSFPPASDVGHWKTADGSLADLAQSLRIGADDEKADVAVIKSVPDPWAQIRTFADTVADDNHASVAQWRGLLALFGLSAVNTGLYQLSTLPVPLRASTPGEENGATLFERILTRLPPLGRLPQTARGGAAQGVVTADWNRPVIVRLELVQGQDANERFRYARPVPIGVLNPACLIAPGRRTAQVKHPEIKWLKNGLGDPTQLSGEDALPEGHYAILRDWLDHLQQDLAAIAGPQEGGGLFGKIGTQIENFRKACAAHCKDAPWTTASVARGDPSLPPLYAALRRQTVLAPSLDPATDSECRINLRSDLNPAGPFKGVILADPGIAATHGKFVKDIRIWGNVTLAEVLSSPGRMAQLDRDVSAAGYFLATPKDLFTARLAQLSHRAIVEGHAEGTRDQLLPLSPLALLLLEPGDLARAVKSSDQGGDRVIAKLTLNLVGDDSTPHEVQRHYAERPGENEGLLDRDVDWTFGEAAVWPNFRSDHWTRYFLRLTYPTSGETIRARFGLSGPALAAFLTGQPESERQAVLRPWCDDAQCRAEKAAPLAGRNSAGEARWLQRVRSFETSEVVEEYQSSDKGFEALFFSRVDDGGAAVPVGCALLAAQRQDGLGVPGVVAIDFGTTNTVACFDDQEPIVFQDRVLHPIRSGDRQRMERGLQNIRWPFAEFLPPSDRSTPTPSVNLDRAADKRSVLVGADGEGDDRPLFNSVIYFQPEEGVATDVAAGDLEKFRDVLGRTRFNLKWGEDREVKIAAFRYLRQFVMMTAAEAVMRGKNPERLTWRVSRPDAMSIDQRTGLRDELVRAIEQIAPGGTLPNLYSEGAAAAKYILGGGRAGNFTPGLVNVIFDIGGGTTDIAIWSRNTLVWTGSYRLAGGQFFTQHLVNNPQFFRTFGLPTWADIIAPSDERVVKIDRARLASVGELLFSGPRLGETMNRRWNVNAGTPEAKALTRTAFTFLGGIAWYVGLVTKGLIEKGAIGQEDLSRVVFALCGRGSGLFSRLHGLDPRAETSVSRLLTLFNIAAGAENPARPSVFVSPTPKVEVVGGMVAANNIINLEDERLNDSATRYDPLGLTIPLGGDAVLAPELDIDAVPPDPPHGYPKLEELKPFIEALAERAGFRIDLREGDGEGAHSRISNEVFNTMQQERAGLREVPFITALRALVSDMARNEAERDSHLTVSEVANMGRR